VPAQKLGSALKLETFRLKCSTKILTLAAPIRSATLFLVPFIAVKGANENYAV
jgi:threonyl-tRNA synthetase